MSWPKLTGEISARYRETSEVPEISYPSGTRIRFVAPGSVTDGQYGLFEWHMPAEPGGPDPHFHTTFSESFYVTDGTVRQSGRILTDEEWLELWARHDQYPVGRDR